MTKEEMLSLGVPTDKVKDLQNMYFRDVNKAAQRMAKKQNIPEPDELKKTINSMVSIMWTALKISWVRFLTIA